MVAKGLMKLLHLLILIKQKRLSLPNNLALVSFDKLIIVFSKVNLLYLLYLTNL